MTPGPARRRPEPPDDTGATLVELLVATSILTVVMSVFTASILQVYRAITNTSSVATTQAELRVAFQRLDKEIRYATWINAPGKVGTTWYAEYADSTGSCAQLRLDATGVLQLRRWTPGSPPAVDKPGQTMASGLVVGTTTPFVRQAAGATVTDANGVTFVPDFQRLQVRLTTAAGGTTATLDSTFTALNTSRSTLAANVCQEGRP